MRMRRKKNLEERIENCEEYIVDLGYVHGGYDENGNELIEKKLVDYEKIFGNKNPVYLEIGCGKGQFASEFAKTHPEINLLAVEVNRNVAVLACEKAKKNELSNLRFMVIGAEKLEYFLPENSIEMIVLNHSCPFPKKRQAKRRLTHENFLNMYKRLLKDGGIIRQKTDNMHFFEFSLCEFSKCGYELLKVSLDLHNSDVEDNIVTEYEQRFTDLGQPIYYLEAKKTN
ncbi:MAG: tRNA (guanosine(46)-N7)-methyltransferase TrmB [Clostridia bacterium]|nr:tRNA (guanosine(46)-N7)-methyltransferase TrmB [Clostridia bacterium]